MRAHAALLPLIEARANRLDALRNRIVCMDALAFLRSLPAESVHCIVTSPPYYGLRDYGVDGQFGLEDTPADYVAKMVELFREARRVLRDDGTLWLNLGDSYARAGGWSNNNGLDGVSRGEGNRAKSNMTGTGGSSQKLADGLKPKDLIGIPWRVAFALQDDGWYLRSDIIWHKPNAMPESVKDRPTKAHEYVFLLAKSERYYYDGDAIREPALQPVGDSMQISQHKQSVLGQNKSGTLGSNYGKSYRNRRTVWTVPTKPLSLAHFATFPPALIEPMILAGCPAGGIVLDMFMGSGTVALVSRRLGRDFLGCDLNPEYVSDIGQKRLEVPYMVDMFAMASGE